ncbi:MAG: hypothetical protein LBR72_01205 [Oscillospiraceae bacterium]|jgi:hypothetical protein|nr:hypothetical protein [Oscillospiraceae bacterium]
MESSVYISSEQIQVVGHQGGTIRRFVTHPLPEGTMINGTITDQAFLTECLASLRAEHPALFKKPSLVVDGSAILVKRIPAPKLNGKQYRQLVRDDFAEAGENTDELVCGYQLLPGGKALLACGAGKNLVDSYLSAFKSAGVKLSSIRIGTQAILSYVDSRPDLQKRSFVLNVIDGVTMLSLIFENGVNVFISRTRLYGDTKEQTAQTVMENLNGLVQFNRSQKFGEVTDSFYLGVSPADLRLLEALNPHVNIKLAVLDIFQDVRGGEQLPPNAHFAYLSALLGKSHIDLTVSRKELENHRKRRTKTRRIWIPFSILYVILLALPIGWFYYQGTLTDKEIAALNEALSEPAAVEKESELTALETETAGLRRVINEERLKLEYEGSLAALSPQLIDLFLGGSGITVESLSYTRESGTVRIGGFGASEDAPANFSEALRSSPLVLSVDYTGYSEGNKFNWNVVLAASGVDGDE